MKTILTKLTQAFQRMPSKIKNISVVTVIAFLLMLLLVKSCENRRLEKRLEEARIPDTIFVKKPYKVTEIKTAYIEKPVKVYVYIRDTILRKEAEHSDIITGIDIKRKGLFTKMDFIKVDRITPRGIVLSSEYVLPPLREIRIDEHGNVEAKKKRFPKLKKAFGIILPLAAGFVIGRELTILGQK